MPDFEHIYALILAGGGGTRLWPKSRNETPKQFLKLVGPDTMLQFSASRVAKFIAWDHIIVITNEKYKEEIQKQLPQIPSENVIAEPEKKDTALAMLTGAIYAGHKDPEAVVINCASDHVLTDDEEFIRVMTAASTIASEGENLVAVGIQPTRPATGFGYIKIGHELKRVSRLPVFQVESFTEKPNTATAQAFISTGKYFWNANMYVWSVKALTAAFQKHKPELLERVAPLQSMNPVEFHAALPAIYKNAEAISIDYAISEKAENLVLIPGDFGWNDVGDWKVVFDLGKKNPDGNVVMGTGSDTQSVSLNSHHNLIHTDGRMIALVGINDMIIIDTKEILMIIPKSQSQDVKKIVEHLKETNKKEYL